MPDLSPSDVLVKAADLIEEHGWWNGREKRRAGRLCAGYAISKATQSWGTDNTKAFDKAWAAAIDVMDDGVVRFNDAPGRTKDEVVSALRSAAEVARG